MKRFLIFIATALFAILANTALAGRIVVNHDEWTLSNPGFSLSPDASIFADNVAQFFTGGGAGTFHAYSTNFGLNESSLAAALSGAGHTYTTGTGPSFDLAGLQAFDGIFVAGPAAGLDTAVLADYVNAGGSVYLAGGTGSFGSPLAEANFWNSFLNLFGMEFETTFNRLGGSFNVQAEPHAIFNNVDTLYENNGNTVLELAAINPNTNIYFDGRYAVYDDTISPPAVPVPAAFWLFGTALIGLVGFNKRRKAT